MYFFVKKVKHAFYKIFVMPIIKKSAFKKCGKKVYIGEGFKVNKKRVSIGDYSSIGVDANILCTHADITIGNHVIIAGKLTMITGRHRFNIIGRYINDIGETEKEKEDDLPIVVEDDVWVASNVTILKGVTIGRGSILANGCIVTKDVEPYSIVAGVPAKKIGSRFNTEEILEHERLLYG